MALSSSCSFRDIFGQRIPGPTRFRPRQRDLCAGIEQPILDLWDPECRNVPPHTDISGETPAAQPALVWLYHNNCRRSCVHCFCAALEAGDDSATQQTARDLERMGVRFSIYATDQLAGELDHLSPQLANAPLVARDGVREGALEARSNICHVILSLHGASAAVHELLAPEGDFAATLAEVRKLREEDEQKELHISCVVHSGNCSRLEELCGFFAELGAVEVNFLKLCYAGKAKDLPSHFFLTGEQIRRFMRTYFRVRHRFKPLRITLADGWGPQYSRFRQWMYRLFQRRDSRRLCGCGKEQVVVLSGSNDVYPCRYVLAEPEYRIGHFDSSEGVVITNDWLEGLPQGIGAPCRSCKILHICGGGCRSIAVTEKQRLEGVTDFRAGLPHCPVNMRVTPWIDPRADLATAWRLLRRIRLLPRRRRQGDAQS